MDAMTLTSDRLSGLIDRLHTGKVLVVGDVMLDEYVEGDVERISPEAPIPVVRVERSRLLLGGAGNVASNIAAMGGQVKLVSVCGDDGRGESLRTLLAQTGIRARVGTSPKRSTTVKTRILARNQQMLRVDQESVSPLSDTETDALLRAVEAEMEDVSVIIVSDYCKGLVNRRLLQGLMTISQGMTDSPKILVDPKTDNFSLYGGVTLLTPNAKETSEGAGLPVGSREEILAAGRKILTNLGTEHLLTTLGARGMALFVSQNEVWHIPTAAQHVYDVTGAGDTVIGTLALGLAAGGELLESCVVANIAAGIVVAEVGAAVATRDQLMAALDQGGKVSISRWR